MSLILDALKKSEAERQRGQVPNLLSPLPSTPSQSHAQKKSGQPWLIVLALLLAVLVAGYFYLKKDGADSADIPTTQVEPAPTSASDPATAAITNTMPTSPVLPEPKPVPVQETPASREDIEKPALTQTVIELPQQETPSAEGHDSEPRIAGMAEMPVEQRQQLPALKLSMHVYSAEPSKRFAIIDGQRVNEGSVLGTAVVEKIRQDGVVLSVQGQSYLLPRP